MNSRAACMALLACAALVGGIATAAERGAAVRKPVRYVADDAIGDSVAWSRRLVGRFRLEGSIQHEYAILDAGLRDAPLTSEFNLGTFEPWSEPLKGRSDCIDFADSAGLQCVLNVFWHEQWRRSLKDQLGGVPDLTPGMLLAGLAPSTAPGMIRILEVDRRGLAHPGAVILRGNTATARPPCVNMPGVQECEQIFTITVKPESGLIFVTFSTTVRAIRSKLARKLVLEEAGDGRMEKSTERYEERVTVSFSMRRETEAS